MYPIGIRLIIIVFLALIFVFETRSVLGEAKSPPYFTTQPSLEEILFYQEIEDSDVKRSFDLPCEAKGDPKPDYFWTKNGVLFDWTSQGDRITQTTDSGSLKINSPKPSDAGQYQCFAENIWGIATSNSVFARKIELGSFVDGKPEKKEAAEGQPYNLSCQTPGGYPKPNINWLKRDFSGKLSGIDDPRITVDPEGALWFSNVTFEDMLDDSVYTCAVTSPYISEIKTGCKVILEVIPMEESSEENEISPILQYASKPEEIVIFNRKARLYCIFGGTPLPRITWYKNGKLIQFRSGTTSKDGGKSIEIKRVTLLDEGNYTCEASNGVGNVISHTTALKVLVSPSFTKKPESVTIDEEETVEFHCQATGKPPPEIIWLHNGKPLSEAPINPRRAVSSNSIIIERLLKNDTGNYGCNATNSLGYVYQDAFVNVLAEPPNITQAPQDREIIEGGAVTLSCRAVGSPKPRIKWMKNSAELSSDDRLAITKSGDLTITDATPADTGEYSCLAQNKFSSVNISANITVRQRTRIPSELAPSDTEIPAGETATFKCSALVDPALDLVINWLQDGDSIDFSSDQHFVQNSDNSLSIRNTSEQDSGMYTCVALTRLDTTSAEASLIVQNIPSPPVIVSLSCDTKDAIISWKNTGDNRAPITSYVIELNKISISDTWEVISNTTPITETFTVTMAPWTNYTFRVLAVNKIGTSLPSQPSSVCSTSPAEVPYQNPNNVTIRASNDSKTMLVSWEPMAKTDHNGPGFHYDVSWKKDVPGAEWENQTIPEWEKGEYAVPNVVPFTKYLVKITSGNDQGQSKSASEIMEYNTPPDIPFKNPDNVTVQANHPTALGISWEPMPKSDQNGPGFYYNISWKKDTPESEWQNQTITQTETGAYTIENLSPNEKYLVTVTAGNAQGSAASLVEPFTYQTPPDVPYKNPENVTVQSSNSITLKLSWKPMPKSDQNGPGFHYEVSWKSDAPGAEWENRTISESDAEEYTVPNVLPFTKYLVKVTAGNDQGPSKTASEVMEYSTPPDIPFRNPNMTVHANQSTTLGIFWEPMPKSDQNGPGFYYNISWKKDTPESEWQSEIITQPETGEFMVHNVLPNEKYLVKVTSGNNQGPAAQVIDPFTYQTPSDVPYKNPENVTVQNSDPTTLKISWKPMSKNEQNGPEFYYNISWKKDTPESEWQSETIMQSETREYSVQKVSPFEKYLVKVAAGNDQGPAAPVIEPFVYETPPDIPYKNPEDIAVQSRDPTTLRISWKPMPKSDQNGPGFNYEISWKKDAPEAEWERKPISESDTGEYIVSDLSPNTKYLVKVIAGNNLGQSTQTPEIVEYTTLSDIPYKNPDNVTIRANSTTLEISWKPMLKNEHNGPGFYYNISWKRDTPESEWQNQTITEPETGEYTVHNVLPNGKYLVKVTSGNNQGPAALVIDPFTHQTPPDVPYKNPEDVTVRAIDPTTLEISWKPVPENYHNGPDFYYNISWKINITGEEQWQTHIISEWDTGNYTVPNVVPYEKYLISVTSGNHLGSANATSEPIEIITPATIPFKNPEDVTIQATGPTNSKLTWKPMPSIDHNGPGFYYKISWRIDTPEIEWETQTIREWETREVTIDVPPYEKHFVTVVSGNDIGECNQTPVTLEGYFEEGIPSEAPSNLALIEIISSTKANISWNRVPKQDLKGNFQGYKIQTWPEIDQQKGNVTETIVEQNYDKVVIDKLTPNVKNKVRILVFNGKHEGPFSDELEINTPEAELEPVQFMEADPIGSSALSLVWKPPLNSNDRLTGYKIYYQTVSETESGPLIEYTPQITDPDKTRLKLSDLKPDTNYTITIQATTKNGDGEKFVIKQKTRPIPTSPLITPDFKIEPIENSSDVKIIWQPCGADLDPNICSDQPIGSEFRVYYALEEDENFQKVTEKNEDHVIIPILPSNKYKFIVSSVDGTLSTNSTMKFFNAPGIPRSGDFAANPEKRVLEQNDQIEGSTKEPFTTETSSPDLSITKLDERKYDSDISDYMWIFVILSLILLTIVFILLLTYLKKLNQGDKYIVREQEAKNRRPDCPEDPDFPEIMQPLNGDVPIDPAAEPVNPEDNMVMIPLN